LFSSLKYIYIYQVYILLLNFLRHPMLNYNVDDVNSMTFVNLSYCMTFVNLSCCVIFVNLCNYYVGYYVDYVFHNIFCYKKILNKANISQNLSILQLEWKT